MPSPRMKRIDINADRKQTSDDCTRVARGKKMQRNAAHREKERGGEREKARERETASETNMRLGEHRCVYSSAAGRHVGTSERGGSERNGQRPPPVITDVNYVRTRTRAGTYRRGPYMCYACARRRGVLTSRWMHAGFVIVLLIILLVVLLVVLFVVVAVVVAAATARLHVCAPAHT